jgi:hypothetical protein
VIAVASQEQGYLERLFWLINSIEIEHDDTMALLAQLKVFIRGNWNRKEGWSIHEEDKDFLLRQILPTVDNLCGNYQYAHLLLDITSFVGLPLCRYFRNGELAAKMEEEGCLKGCLFVLLGLAKHAKHISKPKSMQNFCDVLLAVWLPCLFKLEQQCKIRANNIPQPQLQDPEQYFWEIYHMSIKMACTALNIAMTAELKVQSFVWAEFSLRLLQQYGQENSLGVFEWELLPRGTTEFHQQHAFKWTLKFLQRFIRLIFTRSLNQKEVKVNDKIDLFMRLHFANLVDSVSALLLIDRSPKLKFLEVRLLQEIVKSRPKFFLSRCGEQTKVVLLNLLRVIYLTPADVQLALEEPLVFYELEAPELMYSMEVEHPRSCALHVWRELLEIGLSDPSSSFNKELLKEAFNLIQDCLGRQVEEQVEVGLKLMVQLGQCSNCDRVKLFTRPILSKVPQLLKCEGWLALRSVEMFALFKMDYGE